jgi:thioredoxin 1
MYKLKKETYMTEEKNNKIWIYAFWAVFALTLTSGIVYYAWNRTDEPQAANSTVTEAPKCDQVSTILTETDELNENEVQFTACNFDTEVVQAKGGVVIDAYASWCPHCQVLSPIIAELANEYAGRVKIGKLNSNNQDPAMKENFDFAIKNGLEGYPTVWIYKDGQKVDEFSGERTAEEIRVMIDKQL